MEQHFGDQQQRLIEEYVQQLTQEQRRVYCYIYSLLPNSVDAEEVLQNTNVVLWRKSGLFEPGTNFYRWACGIARLEVLKWREKQSKDSRAFSVDFIEEIGQELMQQGDLLERRRQALASCLGKLREKDRQLIMMRYADGATTKSVAENVGRPLKSVYAAMSRIRDSLMQCINRAIARDQPCGPMTMGER